MCKHCDDNAEGSLAHFKSSVSDSVLSAVPALPIPEGKDFRKHRAKLWELEVDIHCSIIGTCAPMATLRRIYERINKTSSKQFDDYKIHNLFVSSADHPRVGIKKLHKYFEKAYAPQVVKSKMLETEEALYAFWRDCVEEGHVAGGYWALMTHPRITKGLYMHVFGEVHMLSHFVGRNWQTDKLKYNSMKLKLNDTQKKLSVKQRNVVDMQKVVNKCEQQIQKLQSKAAVHAEEIKLLEAEVDSLSSSAKLSKVEDQLSNLSAQLQESAWNHQSTVSALKKQHRGKIESATASIVELESENKRLEHRIQSLLYAWSDGDTSNQESLCGKCVLYVGGQAGSQSNFRLLVEQLDGKFLYHDGGREDSRQSLAGLISQADTVVCPTSCVSHTAMHKIKKMCSRQSKKMIWLRSPSLAAFNSALFDVSAGQGAS